MKCIVKIYSKNNGKHVNTFMLCGTGSRKWDNHESYQWVSFPYGTIYPEIFNTKEEALKWLDNNPHIYYEKMRNCIMTLIKENGDYTAGAAPILPLSFTKKEDKNETL